MIILCLLKPPLCSHHKYSVWEGGSSILMQPFFSLGSIPSFCTRMMLAKKSELVCANSLVMPINASQGWRKHFVIGQAALPPPPFPP